MLIVSDISALRPDLVYWVPALTAPAREGARPTRRSLIDARTRRPAVRDFPAFTSRAECLRWIMEHRAEVEAETPHGRVAAVRLAEWMLGMDAR